MIQLDQCGAQSKHLSACASGAWEITIQDGSTTGYDTCVAYSLTLCCGRAVPQGSAAVPAVIDNGLGVAANMGVLLGQVVGLEAIKLAALHLTYKLNRM